MSRKYFLSLAFTVFTLFHLSISQAAADFRFPWSPPSVPNQSMQNGIKVDEAKVFDDRSLVIMADHLAETLAQINAIDQTKLIQSVGTLQGGKQSAVSRTLSLTTLPMPSIQTTEQFNTNLNELITQQRVTSNAAVNPTVPSPTPILADISQTGYSLSAQDLLMEQMNLTDQILNLRLLLDRSMSDRIHMQPGQAGAPRAQALLGFKVTLEPQTQHKNHAAIVEIEIESPNPGQKPPRLVSLMPEAKTYNVTALSKSSTAFGASAVVKVVTLGFNQQNQSQSFYVYRDTDTVAFRRYANDNKLKFGWEFRPVLNRNAIEPGTRQLFAVIALDESDLAVNATDFKVKAKVTTYWTRFDKKSGVIAGTPRAEGPPARYEIIIPSSTTVRSALGPKIKEVILSSVGQSNILINVVGDNFYNGTDVLVGDKILNPANGGVSIKDYHSLQLYATGSDLIDANVVMRGRYGLSEALNDMRAPLPDAIEADFTFPSNLSLEVNAVTVQLFKSGRPRPPQVPNLNSRLTLVRIGSQTFPIEPGAWRQNAALGALETILPIRRQNLQSNTIATVVVPFVPNRRVDKLLQNPVSVDSVKMLTLDNAGNALWGVFGRGFAAPLLARPETQVIAARPFTTANGLTRVSDTLLTISLSAAEAAAAKNVVVQIGPLPTVTFAKPSVAPKPSIAAAAGPVMSGAAPEVIFTGQDLDQVTTVLFGATPLTFFVDTAGTRLHVFLNKDVTAKAASTTSLAVKTFDGATLTANINIQ